MDMDYSHDDMNNMNISNDGSHYRGSSPSDSDSSTIDVKGKKSSKGIGCYAYLKMLNSMLYLATLLLAFAYYTTTKYTSMFVYNMFFGLLVTRPAVIIFYSMIIILLECCRRSSKASKPWKKKKDGTKHNSDMSSSSAASEGDESDRVASYGYSGDERMHPHPNAR